MNTYNRNGGSKGGARGPWKGKSSGGRFDRSDRGGRGFGDDRGGRGASRGGFGGGRSFGGGRGFGGDRDERGSRPDMHRAVCGDCGKGCEVPFRPNGKRPVFCSDCFQPESRDRDFGASQFRKPSFMDRGDRSDRDERRPATARPTDDAAMRAIESQLKVLNEKLDVLIDVLTADEDELEDLDDEEGFDGDDAMEDEMFEDDAAEESSTKEDK